MAFSVIQSGATLQLLSATGGLTTLSLPTNVTLRTDVPPRWTVYNRYAVLVNTPSSPLTIDATGTVRLLTPTAPRLAPVLTGPNAGTLSGTFRARMTNAITDDIGNILAQSDYGPYSAPVTIANKSILASNLDISPDQINLRILYRTTDKGAVYFQWVDLDGNILTSVQDDLSDAGLSIVAGPRLGTPPRLTVIAEFRGRLFGVGDVNLDDLRYTETGVMYAWPQDNVIAVPGVGADAFGVVALLPRREALGVGRRNMLIQITGTGAEDATGTPDFDVVILSKELGVESQESMVIFRDVAYFLWKDGVYTWGSDGLRCISDGTADGKGQVRSWFATDDFFNRDRYPYAFAELDPNRPVYRLFLCSAGSTVTDRWVEYDITDQTWWGPHQTALFTPTSAFLRTNSANRTLPVIGSADSVYTDQATRTDGASTAIAFQVTGPRHALDDPDRDKFFGQVSCFGKAQTAGTVTVTTRAGDANAMTTVVQSYDMTRTRQRLGRLGTGKHAQVDLTHATAGQDVELYGYDIEPVHVLGRR